MEASSVLFWLAVFFVLTYKAGPALVKKLRKSQFEGYEEEE